LPVEGIPITWPDAEEDRRVAHVARSAEGNSNHNVLALRPEKTYVYWASPRILVPAENWHLHSASIEGRGRAFDPASAPGIQWEHCLVQADGVTDFLFSSDRTYVFYLTFDEVGESKLIPGHIPWEVLVYRPEDNPERIHILFPAQPLDSDPHGYDYAKDFDLGRPIGIPLVFESDEHLSIGDDVQRLIDYYAQHGLIDGGALIRNTDQPINNWDILLPDNRRNPAEPYGFVDQVSSFHWHYILGGYTSAVSYASGPSQHSKRASDAQPQMIDTPSTMWPSHVQWTAESLKRAIQNGEAAALSVGEIIMLAGDFFQSLDEMKSPRIRPAVNVIAGVNSEARFACMIVDVVSLPKSSWVPFADDDTKHKKGQKDFMENVSKDKDAIKTKIQVRKVRGIIDAVGELRGKTKYSEIHTLARLIADPRGRRLDEAEKLLPWAKTARPHLSVLTTDERTALEAGFDFNILALGLTNGQYGALALENAPHFDPLNWNQFERYHDEALSLVGAHAASSKVRHPIPADAIACTAFGLHFLTDAFSAGHMRVPRAQLGVEGALASKLMHDIDGYYGLQVTDGFGNQWRAYGDGNLRGGTLDVVQRRTMDAIRSDGKSGDPDPEKNWTQVKSMAGAAFKQLHYQAQKHYLKPSHVVHRHVSDLQIVLAANRDAEGLKGGDLALGRAAEEDLLESALQVSTAGKLAFMQKYVPRPNKVGPGIGENHPPLFLDNGGLNINAMTGTYGILTKPAGFKRRLCLRWHGVTDNSIVKDFSAFYYLAKFTAGAAAEGWIPGDDTRLVGVLDGLQRFKE
jgi:hypothetical protein